MMAPPVPELTTAERRALDAIGWPLVPSSKAKLLAQIALDPTVKVKDAADAAGVDRDLVRKWRSRDDAFALAERRARNGGDPSVLHVAVPEAETTNPHEPRTPEWCGGSRTEPATKAYNVSARKTAIRSSASPMTGCARSPPAKPPPCATSQPRCPSSARIVASTSC